MDIVAISPRSSQIQALNDALRQHGRGGKILMTNGVATLTVAEVNQIFDAIRAFDTFNGDNDPFGEHDCAVQEIAGRRLIWKIDYYDRTLSGGSPNPADPAVTRRVMTVMLAAEY